MESMMSASDDFIASQLRFDEDTSQLGPLGGGIADDGEMMMTLSRAAESADKEEKKKRKREEKKANKARKRALEEALRGAAEGEENIDPTLLGAGGGGVAEASGSGGDAVMEEDISAAVAAVEAAEEEAGPPAKKARGPRVKKPKPLPAPGYQEIIGPFPDADGVGPAPESMLDEYGNPLHPPPETTNRKKHPVTPDELRVQFGQPGAMQAYLADRWMATKELKRLEDAGVITYKKGTFSDVEENAIRQAVKYFQQSNGLSDDGLVDVIISKREKSAAYPGVWSEIAMSVPGRPVRFVQKYVKRLYDTRARKGKWTEKEDEDLQNAYTATGGSWVKISATVDRSEEDCRARWRDVLKSRADRDAGRWTKEEEGNLLDAIREANIASNKDEHARDPPWEVVTLKMEGKRTPMQCRKKWQAQMWPDLMRLQIGNKASVDAVAPSTPPPKKKQAASKLTAADKHDLVRRVGELTATTLSAVDWESLRPHFRNVKAETLSKAFEKMVTKAGATATQPLSEIVEAVQADLRPLRATTTTTRSTVIKSPKVVPDDADEEEAEEEEEVEEGGEED